MGLDESGADVGRLPGPPLHTFQSGPDAGHGCCEPQSGPLLGAPLAGSRPEGKVHLLLLVLLVLPPTVYMLCPHTLAMPESSAELRAECSGEARAPASSAEASPEGGVAATCRLRWGGSNVSSKLAKCASASSSNKLAFDLSCSPNVCVPQVASYIASVCPDGCCSATPLRLRGLRAPPPPTTPRLPSRWAAAGLLCGEPQAALRPEPTQGLSATLMESRRCLMDSSRAKCSIQGSSLSPPSRPADGGVASASAFMAHPAARAEVCKQV
mmetsp:Transcript_81762/g.264916  ORF Transcript_81762/g.264916 Transcript_81762/m.264916 type:complete len:269 (-) Transcript_81762:11-817(-)